MDLEKLLSGYATNTLTQEERAALFDAAFRSQTLFNALAHDQALKELLDDPRSRQRVLEALEKVEDPVWKEWLARIVAWVQEPSSWALTGSLASAGVAVFVLGQLFSQAVPFSSGPLLTADSRSFEGAQLEIASLPHDEQTSLEEPAKPTEPAGGKRSSLSTSERFSLAASTPRAPAASEDTDPARKRAVRQERVQRPSLKEKRDLAKRASEPTLASAELPAPPPRFQAYVSQSLKSGKAREAFFAQPVRRRTDIGGIAQEPAAGSFSSETQMMARRPEAEAERSGVVGRGMLEADVLSQATPRPLGLRYSILKPGKDGSIAEADPDGLFKVGTELRVSVEVNQDGYLFIMKRDPARGWSVLFPIPLRSATEIVDARVVSGTRYAVPLTVIKGGEDQTVQARAFIVYSRKLLPDFESIVSTIRRNEKRGGTRAAPIDAFMNRTRSEAAGQELMIEKVRYRRKAPQQERAVYVVETRVAPTGRMFLEIVLSRYNSPSG